MMIPCKRAAGPPLPTGKGAKSSAGNPSGGHLRVVWPGVITIRPSETCIHTGNILKKVAPTIAIQKIIGKGLSSIGLYSGFQHTGGAAKATLARTNPYASDAAGRKRIR